jgi:hypothetical protein
MFFKKITSLCALSLSLFILVNWLGLGKSINTYFPMKEGWSWEYEEVLVELDTVVKKRQVFSNFMAPRKLYNNSVTPLLVGYKSGNNVERRNIFYLDIKTTKVIAFQSEFHAEPVVLEAPYGQISEPIEVGKEWKDGPNSGVIKSVSETVTVPAGTFNNCVLTKGDYVLNNKSRSFTTWFAPGVGIVKNIIEYNNNSKMVIQLISHKKIIN